MQIKVTLTEEEVRRAVAFWLDYRGLEVGYEDVGFGLNPVGRVFAVVDQFELEKSECESFSAALSTDCGPN